MLGPANCAVRLVAKNVLRIRPGGKGSESEGLSIPGSDLVVTASDSNRVLSKTVKLKKSPAGVGLVSGQRPGDQIHAIFIRNSDAIDDTCTEGIAIASVKVVYKTE
jgi:hypothetical protein